MVLCPYWRLFLLFLGFFGVFLIVYESSPNLLISDMLSPLKMPFSTICDPGCWEGVNSKTFGKDEDEACLWLEDLLFPITRLLARCKSESCPRNRTTLLLLLDHIFRGVPSNQPST
jgi:hypothetical protein